jgi:hypothetical protein
MLGLDQAFDSWLWPVAFCDHGIAAAAAFWYGAERWRKDEG